MKSRRVPPHAIALELAKRVIRHSPHDPIEMMSGNSRPPVFMWICPIAGCQQVEHTYSLGVTPICRGGASSSVTMIFDFHVWAGDSNGGRDA